MWPSPCNPPTLFRVVIGISALVAAASGHAAPCENPYGSPANRWAIEDAMYAGSAEAVRAAINAAKETRGAEVGCPEDVFARRTPNPSAPSLQTVVNAWQTVHVPRFNSYDAECPAIGREWPAAALGAYYARLAGYDSVPLATLAAIADDMIATQYRPANAPAPAVTWQGAYAYAYSLGDPSDPCYRGGIMDVIPTVCDGIPALCLTYSGGKWSGRNFLVGDFWTSPRFYDGGMAYDHGWTGAMMVEAAIQQTDAQERARFLESALLAGEWSAAEPPVRNHNYTAKNVWLLAQLYALTGAPEFKAEMMDKLERNLMPGVLTDWNNDGMVDGMSAQPFSGLWIGAQRPGRNWDGHNALIWYGCMNAWAMAEAYVALRDRGDAAEAASVRPYAFVMLDNLAWELKNMGPQASLNITMHSMPYPFLIGLWKIAAYENDPQPDWEQAAWIMWNTGYPLTTQNRTTTNVGFYLLYLSGTPYVPLGNRAPWKDCPDCDTGQQTLYYTGEEACLRVPETEETATNFRWAKEGEGYLLEGRYHGVNCPTLRIPDLRPEDSGTYYCEYEENGKISVFTTTVDVQLPQMNVRTTTVLILALILGVFGYGSLPARHQRAIRRT